MLPQRDFVRCSNDAHTHADGNHDSRLLLRPYGASDADAVLAIASDDEWARYLPLPSPHERAHAEDFLAARAQLDGVNHTSWAILFDGTYIGGITIRFQFGNRLGEMGYSIGRPQWGRGFATEAVRAVVDSAFATHADLNRIRAMADARNVASQRVLLKTGFTQEGVLRENRVSRGEPVDEAWFGSLRSEWQPG